MPSLSQQQLSSSSSASSTKLENNLYASSGPSELFNKFHVYTSTTTTTTTTDSLASSDLNQSTYNSNLYQTSSASYSSYQNPVPENVSYDYYSGGQQQSNSTHQNETDSNWQFNSSPITNSSSLVPNNNFSSFHAHHQGMTNNIPAHQNHQYQMILHSMQ